MNDYILTYVNGHLTVASGTDILYSTVKPELEFEFEALFYETPTDNRIKVVEGASEELTEEEIEACKKFCEEFLEKGDYFVEAYEEDSRLYKGRMLKSAATEQSYGTLWSLRNIPCPNGLAKSGSVLRRSSARTVVT